MAILRRRDRPLTSASRGQGGRGCAGIFLIVWGLGFGGGGIAAAGGFGGTPRDWLGLVFAAIGFVVITLGIRLLFPRRVDPRGTDASAAQATLGVPRGLVQNGLHTLRPATSRGCAVAVMVPFSIAIFSAITVIWQRSDGGGGPRVIVIVLSCFGLLVLLGTIHSLLALTNPRAEVDIATGELPIGSAIELPWRLVGSTSRLSNLKIELIGREEASYQRGTKRQTDRSEFCVVTLLEVGVERLESAGTLRFVMPENAVPSFAAKSNKITWFLRFRAPIRLWPDVKDELVLPVGTMVLAPNGAPG